MHTNELPCLLQSSCYVSRCYCCDDARYYPLKRYKIGFAFCSTSPLSCPFVGPLLLLHDTRLSAPSTLLFWCVVFSFSFSFTSSMQFQWLQSQFQHFFYPACRTAYSNRILFVAFVFRLWFHIFHPRKRITSVAKIICESVETILNAQDEIRYGWSPNNFRIWKAHIDFGRVISMKGEEIAALKNEQSRWHTFC